MLHTHVNVYINMSVSFILQQQEQDPTNLYLSNLPVSMDEQELENLLKPFGQVISTRILRDAHGVSRGVGFARLVCVCCLTKHHLGNLNMCTLKQRCMHVIIWPGNIVYLYLYCFSVYFFYLLRELSFNSFTSHSFLPCLSISQDGVYREVWCCDLSF